VFIATPWIDPGVKFIQLFSKEFTPILPILRLPEFIFGMLLCKLMFVYPKLGDTLAGFRFFTLTVLSIIVLLSFAETAQLKSVATLLFGILIIQLSYGNNLIVNMISSKQMVLLGSASYALYMIQGTVRQYFYWLVSNDIISKTVSMFLNPLTAIFFSIMIFIYYEQPTRKLLLRFVRN
jgi:peptidoglycan/LPS O-acetylase OafA/YrhL